VRAARIVLCPGGHPQPLAVPGGDRPGVFGGRGLAVALAEHGAVPGKRVVVAFDGAEARALASALGRAGVEVEVTDPAGGSVRGRGRVRGLALPRRDLPCDTLAVAGPPAPATALARALGAEVTFDAAAGAFAIRAGRGGATGVAGLLAAGEATGTMDAARAAEAGRRAGEAARGP
jgi:sarcosine oxidase subunit alpha